MSGYWMGCVCRFREDAPRHPLDTTMAVCDGRCQTDQQARREVAAWQRRGGQRDYDRRLGQRIRAARLRAGMSQTEFGALLDPPVTYAAVSYLERGMTHITAWHIVQIAEITNEPIWRFMANPFERRDGQEAGT